MESKALFNIFFKEHSSLETNYRFTAKGLQLAMQMLCILQDHLQSEASSYDYCLKRTVPYVKANFKRIVCLIEKAHDAKKAVVVAFREQNAGIHESSSPDGMESNYAFRNGVTAFLKVAIGAYLLGTYLSSNFLLAAVSTITKVIAVIIIEGSAILCSITKVIAFILVVGLNILSFITSVISFIVIGGLAVVAFITNVIVYGMAVVTSIAVVIVQGSLMIFSLIALWDFVQCAWNHYKKHEEAFSFKGIKQPYGHPSDSNEQLVRDIFTTAVYATGGSIFLFALLLPSITRVILSALTTFVFFGCLAVITAIALWELDLRHNTSTETNGLLKNNDKDKDISLENWFQCTQELIKALEDIVGPVPNTYSLVIAYAYLSKKRNDLDVELWLKKYVHNTSSFCMLVHQKYGIQLTPVVVTFLFVVLIFHDRNRFLLESIWETRHLTSNSHSDTKMDLRTTGPISYDLNENLIKTYGEIWEYLDVIYKEGFKTETYKFEIPHGRHPEFELNEAHQIRNWKDTKNQAINNVYKPKEIQISKELDKSIFENQQEQFPSSELVEKQMISYDKKEYVGNGILESGKELEISNAEEFKKIELNNRNDITQKQSELSSQVIVKTGKKLKNEITPNTPVKDSKESEKLNIAKIPKHYEKFRRNNPLAYNRLKGLVETEISYNPESKTKNVNITSENICHTNVLNNNSIYNNIEVQINVSNAIDPSVNSTKNPKNRFFNILVSPPSEKESKTKPSNLRRTSLKDQEYQNADEEVGSSLNADDVERCKTFEIQRDENMDEKIPTLEELEERVKCLLDDGTKVNQWLVDLEERFKNLF